MGQNHPQQEAIYCGPEIDPFTTIFVNKHHHHQQQQQIHQLLRETVERGGKAEGLRGETGSGGGEGGGGGGGDGDTGNVAKNIVINTKVC